MIWQCTLQIAGQYYSCDNRLLPLIRLVIIARYLVSSVASASPVSLVGSACSEASAALLSATVDSVSGTATSSVVVDAATSSTESVAAPVSGLLFSSPATGSSLEGSATAGLATALDAFGANWFAS